VRASKWKAAAGLPLRAADAIEAITAAGIAHYVRQRHLPRVLPVGPDEIADDSIAGRRRIIARLARALRAERNRGRAGHWTYDLNRHIALRQAYLAERRWLNGGSPPGVRSRTAGSDAPGG
jgi:hypothetical protein